MPYHISSAPSNLGSAHRSTRPFLFRFAQPCLSPNRAEESNDYFYDEMSDLVRWSGAAHNPPAIETAGKGGPKTKKCDIEKGDDNKDRRMWQ